MRTEPRWFRLCALLLTLAVTACQAVLPVHERVESAPAHHPETRFHWDAMDPGRDKALPLHGGVRT